jgi:hypothetical protein
VHHQFKANYNFWVMDDVDLQSDAVIVLATELLEEVETEAAKYTVCVTLMNKVQGTRDWTDFVKHKQRCVQLSSIITRQKRQRYQEFMRLDHPTQTQSTQRYNRQKRKLYDVVGRMKRSLLAQGVTEADWHIFSKNSVYTGVTRESHTPITVTL